MRDDDGNQPIIRSFQIGFVFVLPSIALATSLIIPDTQIMHKSILTVVGKDQVGIIAKVCTYLAGSNVNILDISQTIVDGFFNMMMIVDTNASTKEFSTLSSELDEVGKQIGCIIKLQREEIFESMQRI